MGRVIPVKLYPVPLIVACEIVTLAVLAVKVTGSEAFVPATRVPKFSDVVPAASVPTGATPVPLTAIVGELVAVLVNERLPLTAPVVVGANFTVKVAVCP